MKLPKIRRFKSSFTGKIYNSNNEFVDSFEFQEEFMDFRYQILSYQTEGYYVIFDAVPSTKCYLNLNGYIDDFPDSIEFTSSQIISGIIKGIRSEDGYQEFYQTKEDVEENTKEINLNHLISYTNWLLTLPINIVQTLQDDNEVNIFKESFTNGKKYTAKELAEKFLRESNEIK